MQNKIIREVSSYYSDKLRTHGATPQGVDWNSTESQEMRFEQLLKLVSLTKKDFSVLDVGCGFGSLFKFLKAKYSSFSFSGFDISEEMIAEAKKLFPEKNAQWISDKENIPVHDFTFASGIFNVRLQNSNSEWKDYIIETLKWMNEKSELGFSFNMLTKYSDADKMRDYLFYADPLFIFDYCKKNFSKHVALLHDYPLWEFTILVRKNN
jgi:cyclopropane fatty-acyl-phospholipid synthase-like methyltransferase